MYLHVETLYLPGLQREEVKEERPVPMGLYGNHLCLDFVPEYFIDVLNITPLELFCDSDEYKYKVVQDELINNYPKYRKLIESLNKSSTQNNTLSNNQNSVINISQKEINNSAGISNSNGISDENIKDIIDYYEQLPQKEQRKLRNIVENFYLDNS